MWLCRLLLSNKWSILCQMITKMLAVFRQITSQQVKLSLTQKKKPEIKTLVLKSIVKLREALILKNQAAKPKLPFLERG